MVYRLNADLPPEVRVPTIYVPSGVRPKDPPIQSRDLLVTLPHVAIFNRCSENNQLNYLSYEWDKPLIYTVIPRNRLCNPVSAFSCGISNTAVPT
jgi:hypothetical protein